VIAVLGVEPWARRLISTAEALFDFPGYASPLVEPEITRPAKRAIDLAFLSGASFVTPATLAGFLLSPAFGLIYISHQVFLAKKGGVGNEPPVRYRFHAKKLITSPFI
jgi:hypothetical protein